MTRSDDEFINDASDDEEDAPRSRLRRGGQRRSRPEPGRNTEFEVARTWEDLTEGADGTITGAVEGLLEAGKRRR